MGGNLGFFMLTAHRGKRHIYHTGYLPFDRPDTCTGDVAEAMRLSDEGKVLLFQRRHRAFLYDYIAVRT